MYLEIAERVIIAVGEKLKCFNPKLGFAYLATNSRIVLLMESARANRTGSWQKDEHQRSYRILGIHGSCLP
jgi:hypothetical protein